MKRLAILCLLIVICSCPPLFAFDYASISSQNGTTLIIDSDHVLWGFGKMSVDAFENGWAKTFDIAREPREILPSILEASVGQSHRLALTGEGNVYAWGENRYGQVGFGSIGPEQQVREPTLILKNIRKVYAGDNFSLALSTANELYGWGQNSHGALGKGPSFGTTELRPDGGYTALKFPLLLASDIASFKVCSGFVFAFGTEGDVWCWGNNQPVRNPSTREMTIDAERKAVAGGFQDIAQLGYPVNDDYYFFVIKEDSSLWTARMTNADDTVSFEFMYRMLDSVEAVLADDRHVIALDHYQQVWQWDYAFEEKENYIPHAENIGAPNIVSENAIEIAAGTACFFAKQSDGTLLAWGSTADMQLGNHPAGDYITSPVPVFEHARLAAPASPPLQGNGDVLLALEQSKFARLGPIILAASGILAIGMIALMLYRKKTA